MTLADSVEQPGNRESELERRLRRLEDVESIKEVMAAYGECVDNGYDFEGLKNILTPDILWTSNDQGEYHDREEFLAGQSAMSKRVEWAFHAMVPLRVRVHDDGTADGTFYLVMLATFLGSDRSQREPIVCTAKYDSGFLKRDDAWLIHRISVHFNQMSRLSEGWVKEPFWQPWAAS